MTAQEERADRLSAQMGGRKERADRVLRGAEAEERAERQSRPAGPHRVEHQAPALRIGQEDPCAERQEDEKSGRVRPFDGREELAEADVTTEKYEQCEPAKKKRDAQRPTHGRKPGSARSPFADALHVYVDGHLLADEKAAAFHRLVPGESEVLAVDGRRAVESRPLLAVRALPLAEEARLEHDRSRHAVEREGARHLALLTARIDVANARALERDLRKLLDVEEVRGAQMVVALLDVGVDAGRVDRSLHFGLRGALVVIDDLAVEHLEASGDRGEEVADVELDGGVRRVDGERVGERRSAETERDERRPHEDASFHESSRWIHWLGNQAQIRGRRKRPACARAAACYQGAVVALAGTADSRATSRRASLAVGFALVLFAAAAYAHGEMRHVLGTVREISA